MDIKEIGACGVVVIGGAVYGISQYGLNDVLSEEIRHISEVSVQDRPAYMERIVGEFAEAFETYYIETETYAYVGISKFTTAPGSGTFVETVTQDEPVPKKEIKGLKASMNEMDFCNQEEMTMFTNGGWTYSFTMQDSKGSRVFAVDCKPVLSKLRGTS
ncbi:MAG: hypothetical protein HKO02_02175 [Hyphomonadaceae bacterium]|nr:hypothetical protein [Hyphomonadaceae bacterium]